MTHILITGATGFLGRAVSAAVERAGHQVTRTDLQPGTGVTPLDVGDAESLASALSTTPPVDTVIHLAAAGYRDRGLIAGARENPARALHTNVQGLTHLIEAASFRPHPPRVLWSSSTTLYGPAKAYRQPVDESAAFRPQTFYGATKAAAEHVGRTLGAQLGVEVTSLRLPLIYGPGRWYGGSQAQLDDLIRAACSGQPARIDAWQGQADWIHVDDAASAFLTLSVMPHPPEPSYHLVGHRGSFAELANAVLTFAGADPRKTSVSEVPDGAPDLPAIDDTLVRSTTTWAPQHPTASSGASAYVAHTLHPSPDHDENGDPGD